MGYVFYDQYNYIFSSVYYAVNNSNTIVGGMWICYLVKDYTFRYVVWNDILGIDYEQFMTL